MPVLIGAVILLFFTVVSISLRLLRYHKQMKELTRKIEFIRRSDTNQRLTVSLESEEIEEMVRTINTLLDSHQQAGRELRNTTQEFRNTILNLSHDLRTPLTSASGHLQMLEEEDLPPEVQKQYIHSIRKRLFGLEQLIRQLFEFSRIEANELELSLHPLDLNDLFRTCLLTYYEEFLQRGEEPILSIPEEPFPVNCDQEAMKRVFSNIVYNALFHGTGSYVFSSRREGGTFLFLFQNSTDSIEPEDMPRLFERFYTTDRSRSRKSTGLGLTIAKQLVQQMGGQIDATLSSDLFSITVCLPAAPGNDSSRLPGN